MTSPALLAQHPADLRQPGGRVTTGLREAYRLMLAAQGHQRWWPAESPFEVCIGAVLTQNTSWRNVESAIRALKEAGVMAPAPMYNLSHESLARLIRPAGYFNVKARRLRSFLRVLIDEYQGSLPRLFAGDTAGVRTRLLAIPGVGPETADCMLLYAGGHLSFVVDAYTRRILGRHGWCGTETAYDELQGVCSDALNHLDRDDLMDYWQDYHAQLVAIGKDYCRPRAPRCAECPLRSLLPCPRG